jgi:hypothetical protein
MVVRVQKKRRLSGGLLVRMKHGADVDIKQSITVDDQKALIEMLEAADDSPSRATRFAVINNNGPARK